MNKQRLCLSRSAEHLAVGSLLLLHVSGTLALDDCQQARKSGVAFWCNLETTLGSLLGIIKLAHSQVSLGQSVDDLDIVLLNVQCGQASLHGLVMVVQLQGSGSQV